MSFKHAYKNINIEFMDLDHVHPNVRRWNVDKALLKIKTKLINNLRATKPPGLNDYIS